MATNPLTQLVDHGQSPWIDFIRRAFMTDGSFSKLISAGEIRGATSNPAIFEKAIGGNTDYDEQIKNLVSHGVTDPGKIFDELAIADIQMAADHLRPVYDASNGADGFISLEVTPGAADDTERTLREAHEYWNRVQRPNLMIKVPGTAAGIPAVEQLLSEGINVNITLIFAVEAYQQVVNAYLNALEKRAAAGQPIDRIASVASFFVSRVDSEIDKRLDTIAESKSGDEKDAVLALRGKAAIANAKWAYEIFQRDFGSDRFAALKAHGARPQRPLWASTSTKNPAYRDVIYVEELIGTDTVNTMPPATIDAFRDHGVVRDTLAEDVAGAHALLDSLEAQGISLQEVTTKLLVDGIRLFNDPYNQLMESTSKKVAQLQAEISSISRNPNQASGETSLGAPAGFQSALQTALSTLDSASVAKRIWEKDYTFWKNDPETGAKIRNRLGWLDIARVMETVLRDVESFANEIKLAGFTNIVLLGMGGSSLCPEVLRTTFGKQEGFPELRVLDSTDPAAILATERAIELRRALFIVASKSGGTLETNSHFAYFFDKVKGVVGERETGGHFIAITDPGTSLEALAGKHNFRAVFRNPPDIGGRYSALSYFGLVPAALMGIDVNALLDSALAMTAGCGPNHAAALNPGIWLGSVMGTAYKAGRNKITIIASPSIASVGIWIEQLVAESTGKEGKGLVPVSAEPLASPESYGNDRLFAYLRTNVGADATQDDVVAQLEAAGHPVVRITLPTRYALGGEFYRWEMATAVAGHFLDINPFDEPNVQESKDNTKRILGDYQRAGRLNEVMPIVADGSVRVAAPGAVAATVRGAGTATQLRTAIASLGQAGDYIAIMAYIQPTPENDALLNQIRMKLMQSSHLATTVGYGPRFLHSTGQLHKGGANNGVFVQIVAADREDAKIPGEPYTFGTLIHAQSLGDYESLQAHGRRVVRIDLGNDLRGGLAKLAE